MRDVYYKAVSVHGSFFLTDDDGMVISHTDHWDLWGPVWDGTPLKRAYRWLVGKMG